MKIPSWASLCMALITWACASGEGAPGQCFLWTWAGRVWAGLCIEQTETNTPVQGHMELLSLSTCPLAHTAWPLISWLTPFRAQGKLHICVLSSKQRRKLWMWVVHLPRLCRVGAKMGQECLGRSRHTRSSHIMWNMVVQLVIGS